MSTPAIIRAQVEKRIPGALTTYERQTPEVIPTGIASLDREIGGIPKGGLTQVCAPLGINSGRTTLLMSLLAQATGKKEEFCALVDATDCFDPESAARLGVYFSRLLWARCGDTGMKGLERSFRAADILIQNGGFGLIVLNLGYVEERLIRKIPHTTWFCFARKIERTSTAFVVLLSHSAAQSCAALTLHLGNKTAHWVGTEAVSHSRQISGIEFEFEIGRTRTKKPVRSTTSYFTARSQPA
jgi:recombination protein RecA